MVVASGDLTAGGVHAVARLTGHARTATRAIGQLLACAARQAALTLDAIGGRPACGQARCAGATPKGVAPVKRRVRATTLPVAVAGGRVQTTRAVGNATPDRLGPGATASFAVAGAVAAAVAKRGIAGHAALLGIGPPFGHGRTGSDLSADLAAHAQAVAGAVGAGAVATHAFGAEATATLLGLGAGGAVLPEAARAVHTDVGRRAVGVGPAGVETRAERAKEAPAGRLAGCHAGTMTIAGGRGVQRRGRDATPRPANGA